MTTTKYSHKIKKGPLFSTFLYISGLNVSGGTSAAAYMT